MTAIGLIANSILTKSKRARILFDLGAMKSFLIETLAKSLNLPVHGLLESRTGNFNITQKNEKTDALISERSDEIV